MTTLERLARLAYEEMTRPYDGVVDPTLWGNAPQQLRDDWLVSTRAVLDGMKELVSFEAVVDTGPAGAITEKMMEAGGAAFDRDAFHMTSFHCSGEAWIAMINVILEEKP